LAGVPDAGGWLLLQPTKATALAQNKAPVAFRIHDLLFITTISPVFMVRGSVHSLQWLVNIAGGFEMIRKS
jgi:hypothetical protein